MGKEDEWCEGEEDGRRLGREGGRTNGAREGGGGRAEEERKWTAITNTIAL